MMRIPYYLPDLLAVVLPAVMVDAADVPFGFGHLAFSERVNEV